MSACPPLDPANIYHPQGSGRDPPANLATLTVPPPGTGTALDGLTSPQPLNARRPGAPSLPSFELPPPNFQGNSGTPKFPPPSSINHPPNSLGTILTPPATNSSDSTGPGQPVATSASASSDLHSPYAAPYWQGQNQYGSAGVVPRQPWPQNINTSYSPLMPLNHPGRNSVTSPPGTEMPHPYDMNQLPPFQPQSVSSPSAPNPIKQQHIMPPSMLNAQSSAPNSTTSPHPLASNDPYGPSSKPSPIYGSSQQIQSPHQSYPPPYPQAGLGIQPPGRLSTSHQSPPGPPSPLNYHRQPYPSYSLPAMNGPVMSNVHSPNNQMSMVGSMQPMLPGFNSGHVANMQQMYPGHPPPPHAQGHPGVGVPNERPFKCDQCPQSFNRNHDLKRHKRIHMAVKPYPCSHCDKSFSRKDALKVCPAQQYFIFDDVRTDCSAT